MILHKTELKWGAIIGFGISLWVLLEFLLGFHTTRMEVGQFSGYFSILIPIFALYFGICEKRDKELAGSLRFVEGLKAGFLMILLAALIITAFFYLYNTLINPGWIEHGMVWQQEQLIASGMNETQVTETMSQLRTIYSLQGQLLGAFLGTLLQGLLLSAVITLWLRK